VRLNPNFILAYCQYISSMLLRNGENAMSYA
jgi:hypothetical protein